MIGIRNARSRQEPIPDQKFEVTRRQETRVTQEEELVTEDVR